MEETKDDFASEPVLEQESEEACALIEDESMPQFTDYIPQDDIIAVSESNCLALTIRKDYSLTSVKNMVTTAGRMSLKVALSTVLLQILSMLL